MPTTSQYSVNDYPVGTVLTWIQHQEIAIPEIQRPFVWKATKVRDFIDSLYQGYPVGYLITWRAPDVLLKDGTQSIGKRILIDGQQRVISLQAALLGQEVVNKNYKRIPIVIAFHPIEERFEVSNSAIRRNPEWIDDISTIFTLGPDFYQLGDEYCEQNQNMTQHEIYGRLARLQGIQTNNFGVIELDSNLDVETVTEIFVRINSKGVTLNAADFVMSKIAAGEQYDGHQLRKCIDYFCRLAISPEAFGNLTADTDFVETEYFTKMGWLRNWRNQLYIPSYTDLLRVSFMIEFQRGRLRDLVALLSGRNFETRNFEEEIAEDSFCRLKNGLIRYINETNFNRFVMILESAGFVDPAMINSMNAVNFAYALYLMLHAKGINPQKIEQLVRRWFVMSILTGRYTGTPETAFDEDIRNITTHGASEYLTIMEEANLSDAFWNVGLPQQMETSSTKSPYFNIFLASQVKANNKGFLSRDITVRTLLEGRADIHHIFPRNYLQGHNFVARDYNQIANLVIMQQEINIAISDQPPATYFSDLWEGTIDGKPAFGSGIDAVDELQANLDAHCIPPDMETATFENYSEFLEKRRKLMAIKIRDYYKSL